MAASTLALAKDVVRQAFPNALSQLAMVLIGFITILFVSRTEDKATLGGVGIGSMLYNILGLSLGCGITSALDTLVSQSNGATQYRRSGIYLQRAIVIASAVCLPACVLLLCTEPILVAIGQEAEVAARAGDYVRGTVISMWPLYMSNAVGVYLRAQRLPEASAYATWLSNVFHVGSCWLFITHLRMGAFGAGLAFSCTQVASCVFLISYVHCVRPGVTKLSWIRWEWKEASSGVRAYLALALPCAMLMWAEWWCAEVMTLLAGYLGVAGLAAHTSVLQIFILIYMTSGGISCAAAALVGNAIGAGDADLARRSALVTTGVMLVTCAVIDLLIFLNTDVLASLFTSDPEVHGTVVGLFHILLLVVPLDSLQTVIDGILRGLGRQMLAFKVKIVCMWGVRFPLAVLLGFRANLGVSGIWWGSAAGLAATMAAYVPLVLVTDWDAEVRKCEHGYRKLSAVSAASLEQRTASPGTPCVAAPGMCFRSPDASVAFSICENAAASSAVLDA
eukprot:TRINITY_DN72118_c0_g1_i1.p1 TRINITY_DN72118_c0_g1~~TRINITY_DN72118_c0_g1_i1.p1  ORF type:complete len:518 (-),score=102.78 TRINITY_DN72118_c0_g1_i1:132-1649(-)